MKKVQVNAITDLAALIFFIPSLVSGAVLLWALPSGTPGRALFAGISRAQWLRMHDVTSIVFALLVILHIALHWQFYRNIGRTLATTGKEPEK
jgi:hypothetical protein